MPRAREFDESSALDQAMLAFWEQGYEDTSYEDLVRATGVSRYGLYTVFGDKKELFLKALEQYIAAKRCELMVPLEADGASLPAIIFYFEKMKENIMAPESKSGCMFCNAALEISQTDEDVAKIVNGAFCATKSAFLQALVNAKKNGEIKTSESSENLADFLVGLMIGSATLLRTPLEKPQIINFIDNGLSVLKKI